MTNEVDLFTNKTQDSHVLISPDGDLFILSSLCKMNGIKLVRDYKIDEYLDIDAFRNRLVNMIGGGEKDRYLKLIDMTIITTFVGNDFLPKIPSYTDTEHVIDTFNEIYTYLSLPLSEKKGNSFAIKWNNFLKLLKKMYS